MMTIPVLWAWWATFSRALWIGPLRPPSTCHPRKTRFARSAQYRPVFEAHSLRCPEDSRDPHAVGDRLLSVQTFEIGGDRVGETPPSRNRRYRSLLLGLNSPAAGGSSGATFVPMMKPTHRGDRDDSPGFWRLDWA